MKTIQKRLCLLCLCALFLLLAVLPISAGDEQTVVFSLSDATAYLGEEFTVDLSVSSSDTALVDGLLLYSLQYDSTALDFEGFVNYGTLVTGSTAGTNSVSGGIINLGYSQPVVANGSICQLKFKVKTGVAPGAQIGISMSASASKDRMAIAGTVTAPSCTVTIACPHTNTENHAEQPATCKDVGYTAGVYCKDCETYISGHEEIAKSSVHSYGDWTKTSDTQHSRTCTVCEKVETEAHTWNDGEVTTDPTHFADGEKTCTCTKCAATKTEKVDMIAHTYDQQVATDAYKATDATCTAKATYYYSCTCGEKGSTTFEYGDTLPHTYDQQNTDAKYKATDATCTKKATYYYSCTCGAKGSTTFEYGDYAAHSYTVLQTSETEHWYKCANCTATLTHEAHSGGTATCTAKAVCSVCNVSYGSMLDHTYDQQNTDAKYKATDATCTQKATYYYSCTCGAKGPTTFETGDYAAHSYTVLQTSETEHWYKCANCTATLTHETHSGGTATCIEQAACGVCGVKYGSLADHVYDRQNTDAKYLASAATCTEKATYYHSCVCGLTGTTTFESGTPLGHSFTHYNYNNDATCMKDGTETATCDRCPAQDTRTKTGSKEPHTFENYVSNHDATCVKDGTETGTCSKGCGTTDTRTVSGSKLGHLFEHYQYNNDATCQKDGTETSKCSRCDVTDTRTKAGTMTAHDFDDVWHSDTTGHYHLCKDCQTAKSEVIPHTPGAEATETTPQVCTECGYIITPALGHKHSLTKVPEVKATCTQSGNTAYYVCSGCSEWFSDSNGDHLITDHGSVVVPAKGHAIVKDAAVPVTCTKNGKTAGSHCLVCGEVIEQQRVIHATGHTEVDDPAIPATCKAEGTTAGKHCSVCGAVTMAQITIPKLDHTVVTDPAKPATCTQDGLTEGSHCSVCGEILNEQQTVKATGHHYGALVYDENGHWQICENCSEKTATEKHAYTVTTENGKTVYTCGCGYSKTEEKKDSLRAAGNTLTVSSEFISGFDGMTIDFDGGYRVEYDKTALSAIASLLGEKNVTVNAGEAKMDDPGLNDGQKQALANVPQGSALFSITLDCDGVTVHNFEGGKATISMPFDLPENWKPGEVGVFRVEEDGARTAMKTEFHDGTVTWETDGHSYYLVTKTADSQGDEDPSGAERSVLVPVIAAVVGLALVATVLTIVIVKKKKHA